jgi:hypothetical protein
VLRIRIRSGLDLNGRIRSLFGTGLDPRLQDWEPLDISTNLAPTAFFFLQGDMPTRQFLLYFCAYFWAFFAV